MMSNFEKSGEKRIVGYTTGVFDMFHIGHLNILRQAKEHCDYLIVGVSTDELMTEYKHKRPIVGFEDRMAIVSAIRYVDQVVPQTSMDKLQAWRELHYDVLFHGSDWKNTPMYNKIEEELESVGVRVVFFPYTGGVSSSILAEKLRSENNRLPEEMDKP